MLRLFTRTPANKAMRPAGFAAFRAGVVAQPQRWFCEAANQGDREHGTVKWFDSAKGYGFIVRDNGSDLFVHFSSIAGEGYRSLEEGQRVEFEVGTGIKGPVASDVVVIE